MRVEIITKVATVAMDKLKHSAIEGDKLALGRIKLLSGAKSGHNNIMSLVITAVEAFVLLCPFRSLTPKLSHWKTTNANGAYSSSLDAAPSESTWASKNLTKPASVLSPSKSTMELSPALISLMVGKPCTLISSSSLAVLSILAITMLAWSAYFSPSLSQMGVSCLQCPHQGA